MIAIDPWSPLDIGLLVCQPYWILITMPDNFMIVSACSCVKKTASQTFPAGTSVPVKSDMAQ